MENSGILYYTHQYMLQWLGVNFDNKKQPKRKHACLYYGDWCIENALENPSMAQGYFSDMFAELFKKTDKREKES